MVEDVIAETQTRLAQLTPASSDDIRRAGRATAAFSPAMAEADRVRAAIDSLILAGAVYQGRLEPPKGQVIEDWEDRVQTLF
ncbi:hypothetical protein J8J40_32915, partial [Mycobacterium tuberculosis]|nr:hypothetical protein [Mycobacterium tuberculosis]